MKLIILCLCLIMAPNLACCDEAPAKSSSLHEDSPGPANATQISANHAIALIQFNLNAISLPIEPTSKKGTHLLDNMSLSLAEKNLAIVSGKALINNDAFTKPDIDTISAFGMLWDGSRNPQSPGEAKLVPDLNFFGSPENYLEHISYNLPTIQTSQGLNKSAGGITVIWIP